jgi:pyridoxamine 5'-phosphate oxidase-like protein
MRWRDFSAECPELAGMAHTRFQRDQLMLLGTLRPDGSPRISAVECDFVDGDLITGMIYRSVKARDLQRDPRVTVHSWPPGKDNPDGDLKFYGRAVEVTDPATKRAYEDAIFARIQWRPTEPYHCFTFDLDAAGYLRFTEKAEEVWHWRPGGALAKRQIPMEL